MRNSKLKLMKKELKKKSEKILRVEQSMNQEPSGQKIPMPKG